MEALQELITRHHQEATLQRRVCADPVRLESLMQRLIASHVPCEDADAGRSTPVRGPDEGDSGSTDADADAGDGDFGDHDGDDGDGDVCMEGASKGAEAENVGAASSPPRTRVIVDLDQPTPRAKVPLVASRQPPAADGVDAAGAPTAGDSRDVRGGDAPSSPVGLVRVPSVDIATPPATTKPQRPAPPKPPVEQQKQPALEEQATSVAPARDRAPEAHEHEPAGLVPPPVLARKHGMAVLTGTKRRRQLFHASSTTRHGSGAAPGALRMPSGGGLSTRLAPRHRTQHGVHATTAALKRRRVTPGGGGGTMVVALPPQLAAVGRSTAVVMSPDHRRPAHSRHPTHPRTVVAHTAGTLAVPRGKAVGRDALPRFGQPSTAATAASHVKRAAALPLRRHSHAHSSKGDAFRSPVFRRGSGSGSGSAGVGAATPSPLPMSTAQRGYVARTLSGSLRRGTALARRSLQPKWAHAAR